MTNRQKYLPCIGGLRIKMTYSRGCYLFYLAAFCVPSAHFAQTDFDVKHISGKDNFRIFFKKSLHWILIIGLLFLYLVIKITCWGSAVAHW